MNGLKVLINRHLDDFPDFAYYLPIIEKAERNLEPHPDICIECCNSLLQGLCKTVIKTLEPPNEKKHYDKEDTDQLLKRAWKCLADGDNVYEDDFVRRGVSLALALSTIRNARGDISHGKAVPKELQSDKSLSLLAIEMTDSIMRYTLASFFAICLEKQGAERERLKAELERQKETVKEILYDDNTEFNDYLDNLHPAQDKVIHSLALFALYPEDYRIQLEAYREQLETSNE